MVGSFDNYDFTRFDGSMSLVGSVLFFAAEAVLIHLQEAEVAATLAAIGRRFPATTVALDTWSTWMRDHQDEHDAISQLDAGFAWFCDDLGDLDLGTP